MKANTKLGCHTCHYWGGYSSVSNKNEISATCHRYPPRQLSSEDLPAFPTTRGDMVCGEFVHGFEFIDIFGRDMISEKGRKA